MKATLFALMTTLLMVGCGSPDVDNPETLDKIIAEAIDFDKIQKRGKEGEELFYAPNEQTPYTGWVKGIHDNGQIGVLTEIKDGMQDGLSAVWNMNGQKIRELEHKDGKRDGLYTEWYKDGQKKLEEYYKDGKLMSALRWKPNGKKCSETNLKDGNGVVIDYNNNGYKVEKTNYKDGKKDGLWTEWYKDGQKKLESYYKDGELDLDRVTTYWNERGKQLNNNNTISEQIGKTKLLKTPILDSHLLSISISGNVAKLIVCDEGKKPPVFHEFDNLSSGWKQDIEFEGTFRLYSSQIEHVIISVDGSTSQKIGGDRKGIGTFSWKE